MPDTDVAAKAQALIDALRTPLIIFNDHQSGAAIAGNQVVNFNVDRARGLSIYLPIGEEDGERVNLHQRAVGAGQGYELG